MLETGFADDCKVNPRSLEETYVKNTLYVTGQSDPPPPLLLSTQFIQLT